MDTLPSDRHLLMRLLDKVEAFNDALLLLVEWLDARSKEETDLRRACSKLPPGEQVDRLSGWGLGTTDFGDRLNVLTDRIHACRGSLRTYIEDRPRPLTKPITDLILDVQAGGKPEYVLVLRDAAEKVVGLLIERTGKDFQQSQRLRADVEKRLREMGVKEVETRSDTEDSTLGPTSVTKKRGRRLKYKELYALHDEMMKANSDATDEMIIKAYNQKYSWKKHKKNRP
jgi:hypothetical protein